MKFLRKTADYSFEPQKKCVDNRGTKVTPTAEYLQQYRKN